MLKIIILAPLLEFQGFQQSHFWRNFPPKYVLKLITSNYGWRPGADPAFHETIIITVPLGVTGFKTSFFDEDVLNFLFLLFFDVFDFIQFSITLFQKQQ